MPEIDLNALPDDGDALRAIITANQLAHNAALAEQSKVLKLERAKNTALEKHITLL